MIRAELIIQDETERSLRKRMVKQSNLTDLQGKLRTWKDVTGKHKIKAIYLSHTEREITLKTETGREIKMAVKKLSEGDRALLDGSRPFSETAIAP